MMIDILSLAGTHLASTLARGERFARLIGDEVAEVDIEDGYITFGDMRFPIQVIGITDDEASAWVWGWADNSPFDEGLTTNIRALRDYGKKHHLPELIEPIWHLEDIQPYVLGAIARGWSQADVLYRVPVDHRAIYVMISEVDLPAVRANELQNALTTATAMVPMDHRRALVDLLADSRVQATGVDDIVLATIADDNNDVTNTLSVTFNTEGKITDISVAAL